MSIWRKKDDGLHIKILRQASHLKIFSLKEIRESLGLTDEETTFLNIEFRGRDFFNEVSVDKYMLSFEGNSRLLEYDELALARKNSSQAMFFSLVAIMISIVAILINQNVTVTNETLKAEVVNDSIKSEIINFPN